MQARVRSRQANISKRSIIGWAKVQKIRLRFITGQNLEAEKIAGNIAGKTPDSLVGKEGVFWYKYL